MTDHEDEDLRLAIRMSMENSRKRSKPAEATSGDLEVVENSRRLQREMMAAAAEKRMMVTRIASPPSEAVDSSSGESPGLGDEDTPRVGPGLGELLTSEEAELLFSMVFRDAVFTSILSQWSNQGIRFSDDPETSMGLVQHEGEPCGILVITVALHAASESASESLPQGLHVGSCNISFVPDYVKVRALVKKEKRLEVGLAKHESSLCSVGLATDQVHSYG